MDAWNLLCHEIERLGSGVLDTDLKLVGWILRGRHCRFKF